MFTNIPLVSILIPVKNGMPYLRNCIESVIECSYKNLEVIVSDDHSSDGSKSYLESLKDPRIKIVSPTEPLSIGEHWSFLSLQACGDYVKLLCSDDSVTYRGIENQVMALESNRQATMIASRRMFIDAKGRRLYRQKESVWLQ